MTDEETPSWGITPVPDRLRVLGLLDTMLLWPSFAAAFVLATAAGLLLPRENRLGASRGSREPLARPR